MTLATSTILGWPRIGRRRELKRATESYWAGKSSAEQLLSTTAELRRQNWAELEKEGLNEIPSNDFSLYDQVADLALIVDAIPARHRVAGRSSLDTYFAMTRGDADVPPMEMTKWFDTNYHYLVPELGPDAKFQLADRKPVNEFKEALEAGITTRPVLVGPVTFLRLSKATTEGFDTLSLLDQLLPVYEQLLSELQAAGAGWVQLDEPVLATDQPASVVEAFTKAYARLGGLTLRPKIAVTTYFGNAADSLQALANAPVEAISLDFTEGRAEANLAALKSIGGLKDKKLIAGVVNGRNIWVSDLAKTFELLQELKTLAPEIVVSSSCSLLHVPIDVEAESDVDIDAEIRPWLAFATQKVSEITTLTRALRDGAESVTPEIELNRRALEARANSAIAHRPEVRSRTEALTEADAKRTSAYTVRSKAQREKLGLPLLPTTTIGSFPQTNELRVARAQLTKGQIDQAAYEDRMREEIASVVKAQESIGIDVLVHGEPERNDMVQYFAEQLDGYYATQKGWVQSYGTRYVRPPILAGDIVRPNPMTVSWSAYAQSLTSKPMKGMLTGPVTMLAWSFVRDDQPLGDTALQVALALRDEVTDLEAAGIGVIQVDEPALRELLPLRKSDRASYLDWAVKSFRVATSGVKDETQIHTHMCYADFGDVLSSIAALDADAISLEAARSGEDLLDELRTSPYVQGIGPGVYDIHSPRVPATDEMEKMIGSRLGVIEPEQLWINPDCGLKTRGYKEVTPALTNMVEAARNARKNL